MASLLSVRVMPKSSYKGSDLSVELVAAELVTSSNDRANSSSANVELGILLGVSKVELASTSISKTTSVCSKGIGLVPNSLVTVVFSISRATSSGIPVLEEGCAEVRLEESSKPDPPPFVVL